MTFSVPAISKRTAANVTQPDRSSYMPSLPFCRVPPQPADPTEPANAKPSGQHGAHVRPRRPPRLRVWCRHGVPPRMPRRRRRRSGPLELGGVVVVGLQRDRAADRRPARGPRGDRQVAVEGAEAVPHVLQSHPPARARRLESGTVVADGEPQLVAVLVERDGDPNRGPAVLDRVLDGLHAAVVHRRLDLRRVTTHARPVDGQRRRRAGADLLQGRDDPEVGQNRRVESVRDLPELVERGLEAVTDGFEPGANRRIFGTVADQPEFDPDADETLLHAVVEVALELLSFAFGDPDESRARVLKLEERVVPARVELRVLRREQRGRAGRLDELGIIVELGVVEDRDVGTTLALHEGQAAALPRAPALGELAV